MGRTCDKCGKGLPLTFQNAHADYAAETDTDLGKARRVCRLSWSQQSVDIHHSVCPLAACLLIMLDNIYEAGGVDFLTPGLD